LPLRQHFRQDDARGIVARVVLDLGAVGERAARGAGGILHAGKQAIVVDENVRHVLRLGRARHAEHGQGQRDRPMAAAV